MTLKECFDTFGGNYDEVIGRLITEERVKKFLKMFTADKSFEMLCSAMENGDYKEAFRAAHTLKGVCANLGLDRLGNSSSEITESLRGNVNNGADELLPKVKEDYLLTVETLGKLD